MSNNNNINNLLLNKIIENSTFTIRQIQIIYKIYNREKRLKDISSGAYYREVKQCKDKIRKIYYSIIILNLIGIVNNEQLTTINSIVNKLDMLKGNHNVHHDNDANAVINVIEKLLDKIMSL
jgi:hypothetical protein